MVTPPFSFISPYSWNTAINQVSYTFLSYSYIGAVLLALAFGVFLFIKAKRLSSFYLFILCMFFAIFGLFDFITWIPIPFSTMFFWSTEEIFSIGFFVLSYWFLYSFVKDHDLPLWQKVLTSATLVPTLVITALSMNISIYYIPTGIALDNPNINLYYSFLELFFILLIVVFTIIQYRKAIDTVNKKKVALAGAGVSAFLFVFFFAYVIMNLVIATNLWGLASTSYVYNLSPYAIFGMPILLAFLGYLIAKYQAFDVRLIKSIAYMVILMVLLFVGLFFA